MKKSTWTLAFVLAAGLVWRSIFIGSRSIQYDDAFSILLSSRSIPEIIQGTAADTMPPLYYFLLHYWMKVSQELSWLRLFSVMVSLCGVFLLFVFVKKIADDRAGLLAALLAALSPFQVYHAQDIRMYALLSLSQLGYLYFFTLVYIDGPRRKGLFHWAALVLCGIAAMYTHNLAVFALVIPDLFLAVKRRWNQLFSLLAAQVVIGLAALPWLILIPGQIHKIQAAFWTPRPGLAEIVNALLLFTASLPLPPILLIAALVLSLWIVALLSLNTWRNRAELGQTELFIWFTLGPPALLFLVSYWMRPVFVPRGFLISAFMFYAWIGVVAAQAWSKKSGIVLAASCVILFLVCIPYQQTYREFPRSPFQEAGQYLTDKQSTSSAAGRSLIIVHDNKLSFFPARYFNPALNQVFLADEPGSPNDTLAPATQAALNIYPAAGPAEAVMGASEIFFVVFTETIQEYRASGKQNHPVISFLDQHYAFLEKTVFNDLELYHYQKGEPQ